MSEEHAKRVFRAIQAMARSDYGGNTNALLVVYAVEGFLRRLAASSYSIRMTLKGGMLMAAMAARRMTRDADLSTAGIVNDEGNVAAVVAEIAGIDLEADDGLRFDVDSIRTEIMREEADHHGVRAKLVARLATARITTTLDFSFGDLHRSTVIDLPELLGTGAIRLVAYPTEMTLAEKIATMMSRRELNTRDRDFADVWTLSRVHSFSAADVREAIAEVAAHRRHDVVTLTVALADMPDRQAPYAAMLTRMAYQRVLPESWGELLVGVRDFVDPVIGGEVDARAVWDPQRQRWS